jgi:hypothetical protein
MSDHDEINLPADFDDLSKHAPLLEQLRGKGDGLVVPQNYFFESAELTDVKIGIPEHDGFIVPENYFSELAERIISVAQLHGLKNENAFVIPENYFENLTNEITALATISDLKNADVFDVPEGYFAELDNELVTTLALDNLKQDEGFIVPPNYFENFANTIMSRVAMENLNEGSDQDAPEGYFDTLADRIAARIAEEEAAKGKSSSDEGKKKNKDRARIIVFAEVLKRYAKPVSIAASVALVIGVSIWFFNRSNGGIVENNSVATNHVKAKPPINEIAPKQNYIPQQQIASTNTVKPVKDKFHPSVNPSPTQVVKVEKKDIMEQVDLLDENAIADEISNGLQSISNSDETIDESILDQLNDVDINNK